MIRRAADMAFDERANLRGGNGSIRFVHLLQSDETFGKSRLAAKLILPPGASIGEHDHVAEAEMYLIVSGEAAVTDNGQVEILRAGDVMFTGDGNFHSIENRGAENLEVYAIIFN